MVLEKKEYTVHLPVVVQCCVVIAPLWKSGAILDSPCPSVIPSFRDSVLVSTQYLENEWTESDQSFYAHQH